MHIEQAIVALLDDLVQGRVWPDTTPDDPVFPCIVYQVVGGTAHEYLERKLPGSEHYRVQINCWARTRQQARELALQVRLRIIEQGRAFQSARTLGQAINQFEEPLRLYGTQQDFGLWIAVAR